MMSGESAKHVGNCGGHGEAPYSVPFKESLVTSTARERSAAFIYQPPPGCAPIEEKHPIQGQREAYI